MKKLLSCLLLSFFSISIAYADCMFNATPPTFGIYHTFEGASNIVNGNISISGTGCVGIYYTASISTGNSNNYSARHLKNGDSVLIYNLYIDPGRANVFGDGNSGTYTSSTFESSIIIYGKIPPSQWVSPGSYADVLTVTLNY